MKKITSNRSLSINNSTYIPLQSKRQSHLCVFLSDPVAPQCSIQFSLSLCILIFHVLAVCIKCCVPMYCLQLRPPFVADLQNSEYIRYKIVLRLHNSIFQPKPYITSNDYFFLSCSLKLFGPIFLTRSQPLCPAIIFMIITPKLKMSYSYENSGAQLSLHHDKISY